MEREGSLEREKKEPWSLTFLFLSPAPFSMSSLLRLSLPQAAAGSAPAAPRGLVIVASTRPQWKVREKKRESGRRGRGLNLREGRCMGVSAHALRPSLLLSRKHVLSHPLRAGRGRAVHLGGGARW